MNNKINVLYVITNLYIYTEEIGIPVNEQSNLYYTLNPFYVKDPSMIKRIKILTPDTQYIPWDEINNISWDTIFSPSHFYSIDELKKYQSINIKKHILVEDGMYDYLKRSDDAEINKYKSNCQLYLNFPSDGYDTKTYKNVNELCGTSQHSIPQKNMLDNMCKMYYDLLCVVDTAPRNVPVLYTAPLHDDFGAKTEELINDMGITHLILKKHPRDSYHYVFHNANVVECAPSFPGQILFNLFTGQHIFMFPSSICLPEIKLKNEEKQMIFLQDIEINNPDYNNAFEFVHNIGADIILF